MACPRAEDINSIEGTPPSLPIPTREEILASPVRENAPANGATSSFTDGQPAGQRAESPVLDDPSAELERELAGTHLGKRV